MITFPLKHELAQKRFQKKLKIFLLIIFCSLLIQGFGRTYQYEQQVASVYPSICGGIGIQSLKTTEFKGSTFYKCYFIDELLKDLAECESSNNEKAVNPNEPHGKSWGKYQYRIDTWNWALERYGLGKLDILNGEHQDIVTRQMLSEKRWKNWFNCLSKYYEN